MAETCGLLETKYYFRNKFVAPCDHVLIQTDNLKNYFIFLYVATSEPGSVVGIETGYGLDGPGIESRWGRDFLQLSRPALRPIQPPVQWVPGLSRG